MSRITRVRVREREKIESLLRAVGMTKEAAALRKEWRKLTLDYQAQIVVKLNTKDDVFSNTIITIFGCSDKKIRQNLRNKSEKLLYKKDK